MPNEPVGDVTTPVVGDTVIGEETNIAVPRVMQVELGAGVVNFDVELAATVEFEVIL
jgi:hypothetical protein